MDIYDQLLEIHSELKYDEMWLSLLEGYFEEYEVDNIDDFVDKTAAANVEGAIYSLISEGNDILSLKETDEWFTDDEYDEYDY
jgi:hypothetical protein